MIHHRFYSIFIRLTYIDSIVLGTKYQYSIEKPQNKYSMP
jgi:hypothetical protein